MHVELNQKTAMALKRIEAMLCPNRTRMPAEAILQCAVETYEKDLQWLADQPRPGVTAQQVEQVEPGDGMPPAWVAEGAI